MLTNAKKVQRKLFQIYDFRLHHDKIPEVVLTNGYNLEKYVKYQFTRNGQHV